MATKRMLIDSTHPEETRVAVIEGDRLTEYDVEIASRRQLKGNIYLAKVTRVEPSLQAAFVEYGGNRHGFLAFNEIHPDYYQIPVADREALLAEQAAAERAADARRPAEDVDASEGESESAGERLDEDKGEGAEDIEAEEETESGEDSENGGGSDGDEIVETVGGVDEDLDLQRPRSSPRHYKIQEVIKRRQILLVQVVKEERGTKGAALTTYLSIAGRYCVLMPNTTRGGGISRKITSATDRKRLKKILSELGIPEGMAVIVRTAGAERSKAEIRRDYEYLIRLWNNIRDLVLSSMAPTLVYEEGNLIKRSLRDLYDRDTDEILIEGETAYRTAKDFMKLFIPSHAKKVQLYEGGNIPLYHRYQVENELEAMHLPRVELKSGGSIVLNPTEALVAVDVNSGRSTRERHIEETALRTNIEACDEIARQLRLRDLAGLIVIDFIDMENTRNQSQVERRLKEAMKSDRARVQLGRISTFGLLELSRQRLRPSLFETSFTMCTYCAGTGVRRTTESTALSIFRRIEQEAVNGTAEQITVKVPSQVAFYLLNNKRASLLELEKRYAMTIVISGDDSLIPPDFELYPAGERARYIPEQKAIATEREKTGARAAIEVDAEEDLELAAAQDGEDEEAASADEQEETAKRSRRRRPRRRRRPEPAGEPGTAAYAQAAAADSALSEEGQAASNAGLAAGSSELAEDNEDDEEGEDLQAGEDEQQDDEQAQLAKKRRRRGKRGGRRRARRPADESSERSVDADVGAVAGFTGLPATGTLVAAESPHLADVSGEPLSVDAPAGVPGDDQEDRSAASGENRGEDSPAGDRQDIIEPVREDALPEAEPETVSETAHDAPGEPASQPEQIDAESSVQGVHSEDALPEDRGDEEAPAGADVVMTSTETPEPEPLAEERQQAEDPQAENLQAENPGASRSDEESQVADAEAQQSPPPDPSAPEEPDPGPHEPEPAEQETADEGRTSEALRTVNASRTVVINVDDAEVSGEGGRRGWWQRLIS